MKAEELLRLIDSTLARLQRLDALSRRTNITNAQLAKLRRKNRQAALDLARYRAQTQQLGVLE